MKKLIVGAVAVLLLSACSADQPRSCDWDDKRDADYNAAVDAIDLARTISVQ
jgi:uncharacterized lipoprotein